MPNLLISVTRLAIKSNARRHSRVRIPLFLGLRFGLPDCANGYDLCLAYTMYPNVWAASYICYRMKASTNHSDYILTETPNPQSALVIESIS